MRTVALAVAVNDEWILQKSLLSSPDLQSTVQTMYTFRESGGASAVYNEAIGKSEADLVLLVHQDVYLPRHFFENLNRRVTELDELDPNWAVAGPIGIDGGRVVRGRVWSSAQNRVVGTPLSGPARVESLDELALIVRPEMAVPFDERLPGFHLFGTDVVQMAKRLGRASYAIDLPLIHHSRPVLDLGGPYRAAYRYCQKKYAPDLPIPTLMGDLEASRVGLLLRDLRTRRAAGWRKRRGRPVGDPRRIARELLFDAAP